VKQKENDTISAGLSYKDAVQYLMLMTNTAASKKVLQIQRKFGKDETFRTKVNAQD